jgi:hypothetical protein
MPKKERFTSIEQERPKNRRSQLLIVAALLVTILGGFLAIGGLVFGLVLLGGGFVALIALTVWSLRNWDY